MISDIVLQKLTGIQKLQIRRLLLKVIHFLTDVRSCILFEKPCETNFSPTPLDEDKDEGRQQPLPTHLLLLHSTLRRNSSPFPQFRRRKLGVWGSCGIGGLQI